MVTANDNAAGAAFPTRPKDWWKNLENVEVVDPDARGARILVLMQPQERRLVLPRPKTARQLLHALGLEEECALVARQGELLTPDRQIWPGDEVLVRTVASAG